jgi:raffinose/stachyose/melibiose transport system substrate-binding protein
MKRMITRRDFLAVGGGAALTTMLTGCNFLVGSERQASGGKDNATVWDISTGGEQELLENLVKRFNDDHDISTTVQFFQNDPYKNKLRVSMGAGNPPDIFYGWGGGILKDYVDAGKVYDITGEIDTGKYFLSVMNGVTFDDKVYGVPKAGMQPVVFYYNKPIFEENGLSIPKTWSELLGLVEQLKETGITPISLAGQNKWPYLMYEEYLVNRIGGPEPFQGVVNNEPEAWSDPAFIEANTMIQELVAMGAFPDGFTALNYDTGQSTSLLYSGRAATQLMGSWDYADMLSSAPEFIEQGNLGWFDFPAVEGGEGDPQNVAGNLTNFYSVTEASNAKEASLTFLEDGVMSDFFISGLVDLGLVPPVEGIESKLQETGNPEWSLYVYNLAREAPYFDLSWDQALPPEPAQELLTNLDRLFLREITPRQFSENMNKTIES